MEVQSCGSAGPPLAPSPGLASFHETSPGLWHCSWMSHSPGRPPRGQYWLNAGGLFFFKLVASVVAQRRKNSPWSWELCWAPVSDPLSWPRPLTGNPGSEPGSHGQSSRDNKVSGATLSTLGSAGRRAPHSSVWRPQWSSTEGGGKGEF